MVLINLILSAFFWVIKAIVLALTGGLWAGFLAGNKHKMNVETADEMIRQSREDNDPL